MFMINNFCFCWPNNFYALFLILSKVRLLLKLSLTQSGRGGGGGLRGRMNKLTAVNQKPLTL